MHKEQKCTVCSWGRWEVLIKVLAGQVSGEVCHFQDGALLRHTSNRWDMCPHLVEGTDGQASSLSASKPFFKGPLCPHESNCLPEPPVSIAALGI